MRPPFPYYGGKQLIANQIIAHFPPHEHYVEPYCGGLSVLAAKAPATHETVNDLDGDLMLFWRVLRDRPDDLIRACALTPHSRGEYLKARDEPLPTEDLERARRVWTVLTQGRSGRRTRTGWRHYITPGLTGLPMSGYLEAYVDRMAEMAERLHHVSLECRPALDVIHAYGREPAALLYVDPPYLGATRSQSAQYVHEMREPAAHENLAEALHRCRAAVILSAYHSDLYDQLYADWHHTEIRAFTGQSNSGAEGRRTEVLWSNRPLTHQGVLDLQEAGA